MSSQSELERTIARLKSYTGPAVLVFILYWLVWIPGLFANLMYYKEAKRMQRLAGQKLPGVGCLSFMLWLNVVGVIVGVIVIIGLVRYPELIEYFQIYSDSNGTPFISDFPVVKPTNADNTSSVSTSPFIIPTMYDYVTPTPFPFFGDNTTAVMSSGYKQQIVVDFLTAIPNDPDYDRSTQVLHKYHIYSDYVMVDVNKITVNIYTLSPPNPDELIELAAEISYACILVSNTGKPGDWHLTRISVNNSIMESKSSYSNPASIYISGHENIVNVANNPIRIYDYLQVDWGYLK